MNKLLRLVVLLLAFRMLCSCENSCDKCAPPQYVSEVVVQFEAGLLKGGIDWDQERDLFLSDECLAGSAKAVGADLKDVRRHLSYGVDPKTNQIWIHVIHEQERWSRKLRDEVAARYVELRNTQEGEVILTIVESEEPYRERRQRFKDAGLLEEEDVTLEMDRLTFDKAMFAFDEGEGGDQVGDTFELLSLDDTESAEVNPDQLSYQRALEAVYERDPAIAKQEAVMEAKRKALVGMIGSYRPDVDVEDYKAAKLEYERARDLLRKLKVQSSALYRKE
jgi:hypothetical protein